jgi:hypothetical protein
MNYDLNGDVSISYELIHRDVGGYTMGDQGIAAGAG